MDETVIEGLRAQIAYWRIKRDEGRRAVEIAEQVLPGLEAALRQQESAAAVQPEEGLTAGEAREKAFTSARALGRTFANKIFADIAAVPVLRGDAREQVEQALRYRSPQSSKELEEMLETYGRGYSSGAIGYALRDLRSAGIIQEEKKVGNLRYYSFVPEDEREGQSGQADT